MKCISVMICTNYLPMQETRDMPVRPLGGEDPPEEETATHSSILAWSTPWTEEPGGLQSTQSQRARVFVLLMMSWLEAEGTGRNVLGVL